ncbi:MAG TPA: trehalose-6-phosphate synthase [Acidimicrobiales bacterium]|nr:trehalose-6-phosphate synthase [Acidimicrobiales bacterium]
MQDVVVVSNRGPLSFRTGDDGQMVRAGTGGGLAATLHPLLRGTGATWVAAAMTEADRRAASQGLMQDEGLRIVTVEPDLAVYDMAYNVVSNSTLWFCHHHLWDLPRRPRFDRRWGVAWEAYREVNRAFADVVADNAPEGARVLVQDYHLSLVGAMLAERRPDLRSTHFSHTPFADPGIVRALPSGTAGELLAGMAGFGACGFHTARWEASFRAAYADPALLSDAGVPGAPATYVAPLGPHPEALESEAASDEVAAARRRLEELTGGRRLIVRVDRVELSKNILRGLWAFDELLQSRPEWRGKVTMLTLAYPSREALAEYLAYRSEVEHTVEMINERWTSGSGGGAGGGSGDWVPVVLSVADDRARSMAALSAYDVLLVNPVRDGLNLVAKEGPLVNRTNGVLVLSREAGAWEELHPAALGVNPFDVSHTAAALDTALSMDESERRARAETLRKIVRGQTAADWLGQQLDVAAALPSGRVGAG